MSILLSEEINGVACKLARRGVSNAFDCDKVIPCSYCGKPWIMQAQCIFGSKSRLVCMELACIKRVQREMRLSEWSETFIRGIYAPPEAMEKKHKKQERNKIGYKIRYQVLLRDGRKCKVCGSEENPVIDHIVPVCQGGRSDLSNLQVLCFMCNSGKGGS